MEKALIDLSVLIVFFNRPQTLRKVFDRVKEVKPSRLFLYQDGARENRPDDVENVKKCREIVGDIDWDCEVHTLYQEKNMGVDPSGYLADVWAFSLTDKCLVLEDDVVPTVSLFYFVKEMLDKYENDERVMLISGMNLEERTDVPADYFFSRTTITWGWASWGRVVRKWDNKYSFLTDEKKLQEFKRYIKDNKLVKNTVKTVKRDLASGIDHFESILIANQHLNKGLSIVPKNNMVLNIGATAEASHFSSELKYVPRGIRRLFKMNTYEIDYNNIVHPTVVEDYPKYKNVVYKTHGWNRPVLRALRFAEVCLRKIFDGKFKEAMKDIKSKFKK